jgi:hypothetical protein
MSLYIFDTDSMTHYQFGNVLLLQNMMRHIGHTFAVSVIITPARKYRSNLSPTRKRGIGGSQAKNPRVRVGLRLHFVIFFRAGVIPSKSNFLVGRVR